MTAWRCRECKHIVIADVNPTPLKWDDGHICSFEEHKEYFNFDDLVVPPATEDVIFYKGKVVKDAKES